MIVTKKKVPKMPDKIYACWGGGGLINDPGYWFKKKLDEDPYDISFTRTDLAQSLADALETIANQKLSTEAEPEDWENGDFEYAYEEFVKTARAALANYRKGE